MKKMENILMIQKVYAGKFQKTVLNQQIIKVPYQVLKYLFSVPIMCLIFVIKSKTLDAFSLVSTFDNLTGQLSTSYQIELVLASLLFILLNFATFIGLYLCQSQIIIKIQIIYLLFAEATSNIVNAFAFQTVVAHFASCYILSILLIIVCIQNFVLTYLVQAVFISQSFQPVNILAHKYCQSSMAMIFMQKIGFILFFAMENLQIQDSQMKQIAILFFLISTESFRTYKSFDYFYYYSGFQMNIYNNFCMVSYLLILTIIFLYQAFEIDLIRQNFIILTLVISIFALLSAYNYLTYNLNELYFKSVQQILQQNLQIIYLITLFQLEKNIQNQYCALIVTSIKKEHQMTCQNIHCYCQKDQIISHSKEGIRQKYQSFLKGYSLDVLNKIQLNESQNPQVVLKACYFRFQKFKSYAIVMNKLNNSNLKNCQRSSIKIQYSLLIDRIKQYIQQQNRGSINSELPLLFEQKMQIIETLIVEDIKLKQKKWKYLTKGLCKSSQIQIQIDKQISILQKIQNLKLQAKDKFMKNPALNFLMIFYFGEIIFLRDQTKDFVINLKQILIPVRYTQVINDKELLKNIFHQRCALIQSKIQDSVNFQQFTLNILNCNENVLSVFGYEKTALINKNCSIIYPQFLWKQQKKVYFNLTYKEKCPQLKKGQQFIKQTTQQYFINNLNQVFSGLRSLKLIIRADNSISLIMLVFKKHEENIILLNQKYEIEEVGNVFKEQFGHVYHSLPLQLFFSNNQKNIQAKQKSRKFLEDCNNQNGQDKIFSFLQISQFQHQWNQITEEWVEFIKKYRSKFYTDNPIQQEKLKNQKNTIIKKIRKQIRKIHVKNKIQQNQVGIQNQILETQSGILHNENYLNNNQPEILVTVHVNKQTIKQIKYFSIMIKQIQNKQGGNQIFKENNKTLSKFSTSKDMNKVKKTPRLQKQTIKLQLNDSQTTQRQCIQNNLKNQQQQSFQNQSIQENKKKKNRIMDTASSINSSKTSVSSGYIYHKFIQFCRQLFQDPQKVKDRRLNTFSIISVIICFSLIAVGFFSNYYLSTGLYQNQGIFFADGTVSDNMQLAEFMYNRGMNLVQLKNQPSQIPSLDMSINYQRNNLYDLMTLDLNQYLKAVTILTKTKFYEYISIPVKWYQNYQSDSYIIIQTNQLFEYLVYHSKRIQQNTLNPTNQSNIQIMDSLRLIDKNFPELKRINHYSLNIYQDMSNSSMSFIGDLSLIFALTNLVLTFMLLLWIFRQFCFRIQQKFQCYSIYKIIPIGLTQNVSQFYSYKSEDIKKQKDLKIVQKQFQRTSIYLPLDISSILNSKKAIFLSNKKFISLKMILNVIIFIILNSLFMGMNLNYRNLFLPVQKMMVSVNSIMDSQNYMIQAFCDLKSKYLIENSSIIQVNFFDQILSTQRQNQVLFNKVAIDSLGLFSSYDSNYKTDFIKLLVDNNCDLAKDLVSPELYQKCLTYPKYNLLDDGVITGMNFFQRRIRQTLQYLRQKHLMIQNVSQNQRTQMLALFNGVDFRQIDEYMFFMFRMYQTTQARIYTSLDQVLIVYTKYSYYLIAAQTLVLIFGYLGFLYLNYKQQKKNISQLYISFLLIPSPLIRLIKGFQREMERCLQYKRS